jgi:hypothetical protein
MRSSVDVLAPELHAQRGARFLDTEGEERRPVFWPTAAGSRRCLSSHRSGPDLVQRLDPRLPVVDDDQNPGALGHRVNDLPGQAPDRGLVGWAVSHDEGLAALAQAVEHPPERGSAECRAASSPLPASR